VCGNDGTNPTCITPSCSVDSDCPQGNASQCNKIVCTNGGTANAACVEVADAADNGTSCTDGLYCNEGETCQNGSCQ
jgi:hypothetical protein